MRSHQIEGANFLLNRLLNRDNLLLDNEPYNDSSIDNKAYTGAILADEVKLLMKLLFKYTYIKFMMLCIKFIIIYIISSYNYNISNYIL